MEAVSKSHWGTGAASRPTSCRHHILTAPGASVRSLPGSHTEPASRTSSVIGLLLSRLTCFSIKKLKPITHCGTGAASHPTSCRHHISAAPGASVRSPLHSRTEPRSRTRGTSWGARSCRAGWAPALRTRCLQTNSMIKTEKEFFDQKKNARSGSGIGNRCSVYSFVTL